MSDVETTQAISGIEITSAEAPTVEQITLKITPIDPDILQTRYYGITGNDPATYSNKLYLWQAARNIPWNQAPRGTASLTGTTQDGSTGFQVPLQNKNYIVGYAVGPETKNIVSTCTLNADGSQSAFSTRLELASQATDSVVLRYTIPTGALPKTWKHRVMVWRGTSVAFDTSVPPLKTVEIRDDLDTGTVRVEMEFLRNVDYTFAYVAGEKQSMIGAAITFKITAE